MTTRRPKSSWLGFAILLSAALGACIYSRVAVQGHNPGLTRELKSAASGSPIQSGTAEPRIDLAVKTAEPEDAAVVQVELDAALDSDSGASSSQASAKKRRGRKIVEGFVTIGFEQMTFISCAGGEEYWLARENLEDVLAGVVERGLFSFGYVRGEAVLSPPGSWGHLGHWRREIRFISVESTEGNCGDP